METTTSKPNDPLSSDAAKLVDRAAQSAHQAIDRVAAKAAPAVEQFQSAASSAADTLRAKADALGDLEDQWIDTARDYVRTNPLTAVAAGVLLGVLISRLAR